jgi:hypothetical protein
MKWNPALPPAQRAAVAVEKAGAIAEREWREVKARLG